MPLVCPNHNFGISWPFALKPRLIYVPRWPLAHGDIHFSKATGLKDFY